MAMLGTIEPRVSRDWSQLLQSRWLWCIGAILFLGIRELGQGYSDLLVSLGDTDDATRLYEVRHMMASGAWFDMTLPRLGGDAPLVSHWSRLIDLPLAGLLTLFGWIMTPESAELATRIVWPLLVLFGFLAILVRVADKQSGAAAAGYVLFFGLTCMAGLFQFRIGRIDHHNGMILGSIGGLLVMVGARAAPREGYLAGVLIGIGLGVGFEPLAFLLPAIGLMALLAVYDLTWLDGVRNMAVALCATLALIFLATVAPSLWLSPRCDSLSLNMVLLAAGGAGGLMLADKFGRGKSLAWRVGILAGCGGAGLLGYAALDTRCLAGPFAQVDPRINAVWLDHVIETISIFKFYAISPAAVLAFAASVLIGIFAAFERWQRLRSPEALVVLGLMLVIAPTGAWMVKLMPYASWMAVFATALSIADLKATEQLSALSRQLTAALIGNQWTIAMLTVPLLTFGGVSNAALNSDVAVDGTQCMKTQAIRSLTSLPKGLFVGSIDFGSYIVALTPHDALAAPYHRIDKAILLNQALLAAEPKEAQRLLAQARADYVVLCMPKADTKAQGIAGAGLEARLKRGDAIDFLAPIEIASPVPELRVWQVRKDAPQR